MLSSTPARGFTIVELLVGMAILGVLLALGAPAMGTYLQNSKLASATAGLFAGIQMARTEAIRRNVQAQFVLTNADPSQANLANTLAPTLNGPNWVVRAASGAGFDRAIDARSGSEGEGSGLAPAIQIAGAASAPAVFDGTIPFNGFGGTATGATYTLDVSNPTAGVCVNAGGSIRCRRIVVSPGGQINACDPAAPVGDNRAC